MERVMTDETEGGTVPRPAAGHLSIEELARQQGLWPLQPIRSAADLAGEPGLWDEEGELEEFLVWVRQQRDADLAFPTRPIDDDPA